MDGNKIILVRTVPPGVFLFLKSYVSMFKIHLCLYISLSAILGHAMAARTFSFDSLLLGLSVLILAFGSAVLNNVQDRVYDGFFKRTCHRSLPQKKIPVVHARGISLVLIGCGLSGLLAAQGAGPFLWGGMAVFCYNGLYTPLKKRSLLAIIPGSITGMLPPLIGWTAAGKSILDPQIWILMGVFGLWQIPHFFMVLLKTLPQQSTPCDLKRFPCFTRIFSPVEIKVQILIWTSLFSLAILLFLLNGSIKNPLLSALSALNAVVMPFLVLILVFNRKKNTLSFAFAAINLSLLFFMGAGICDTCF